MLTDGDFLLPFFLYKDLFGVNLYLFDNGVFFVGVGAIAFEDAMVCTIGVVIELSTALFALVPVVVACDLFFVDRSLFVDCVVFNRFVVGYPVVLVRRLARLSGRISRLSRLAAGTAVFPASGRLVTARAAGTAATRLVAARAAARRRLAAASAARAAARLFVITRRAAAGTAGAAAASVLVVGLVRVLLVVGLAGVLVCFNTLSIRRVLVSGAGLLVHCLRVENLIFAGTAVFIRWGSSCR